MREKIKTDTLYMFIVGALSLVSLTFLPMIGSTLDLGWNLPNTPAGWAVWISTKIIVAVLNMMIFHCFVQQGKINVRDNEEYKLAWKYWHVERPKVKKYISPGMFYGKTYGVKGTSIIISTLLATFAITQCLLVYDLTTFLTYLFVIGMGIAFGLMQMKKTEEYWTVDFVEFVDYLKEKDKEINNGLVGNTSYSNSTTIMNKKDNSMNITTDTSTAYNSSSDTISDAISTISKINEIKEK